MICRLWRGWTTLENANAYEAVVRGQVIPKIESLSIPGFRKLVLLRRPLPSENRVEFATLMWFDSVDAVKAFAGDDYELSHVPEAARSVLLDFDKRAAHFEILDDRGQERASLSYESPRLDLGEVAALLVVDVQNGFNDPSWGARNNLEAEANIRQLLAAWRGTGWPIHHVHHASVSCLGKFRPGTPGHDVKVEALPEPGEPIYLKSVNSAFIGTNLEATLREACVDKIVIVGLTTNHCISTTARMAGNLGFDTFVVSDATATFDRPKIGGQMRSAQEVHEAALSDLSGEFATILTTEEVRRLLAAHRLRTT